MAERRANLMEPRMELLLDRVGSKFTLVTLASMRAREINEYNRSGAEDLGKLVPPQVILPSSKPLSLALEEIRQGKIRWIPVEVEAEVDAEGEITAEVVDVVEVAAEETPAE